MATRTTRKFKTEQMRELGVPDDCFPYTPADGTDITDPEGNVVAARAIRCDTGGTLAVWTEASGTTTRLLKFASGETRQVRCTRILASGTVTAAGVEVMT